MTTADLINLAIAVATTVSVAISLAVAIVTYKSVQASRAAVDVMKEQLEASTRPYILIAPTVRPMSTFVQLRILNSGTSSAKNLRLSLDKDYFFNAENSPAQNIRKFAAFVHPIYEFPPQAELVFHLGVGHRIFTSDLSPLRFTVTAKYEFGGKTFDESTIVDLQPYMNSGKPIDPVAERLEQIRDELKSLRGQLPKHDA
jgi:hypothetical protein